MISVDKLVVKLQERVVLNQISCTLLPGRITIFIGKSGAGKTTLFKSLIGLVERVAGSINLSEQNIASLSARKRSEEIGYVFQDLNLFPHLTVLQNCVDPLLIRGISLNIAQQKAHEILGDLEMQEYAALYPSQLSGGQQQRVAIARALCLNPKVLLLDEPTASLDPESSAKIALVVKKLAQATIAIGVISHDMAFVEQILDHLYVMQEGTIKEFFDAKANAIIPPDSLLFSFLRKKV